MKLQTAIDRVTLSKAEEMVKIFAGKTDIIEIGTSLIKDYGLFALKQLNEYKKNSLLLADLKGFDILTVMGSSSRETLEKCYEVSQSYEKYMLIDLLECSTEKIHEIADFENAIYCLHTSVDKSGDHNIIEEIQKFKQEFPQIQNICVAGGIKLDVCKELKKENIQSVIVGSAITKAENMEEELRKFKEVIK